jgi:hypothetical protein
VASSREEMEVMGVEMIAVKIFFHEIIPLSSMA